MRARGFLFGLVGGLVGAVVVFLVILAAGFPENEKTVVIQPTGTSTASSPFPANGLTPAQIYQKYSQSVVEIISTFPGETTEWGSVPATQGIGSGFVVDSSGLILTNAHVVVSYPATGGSGAPATDVTVIFKGSGTKTTSVKAEIVGVDGSSDVAILKVDPDRVPKLQPVVLGDSNEIVVGEPVVAIGNPLGYDYSVSSGIVSAIGRTLDAPNGVGSISDGIQTDAAINPGNSGGPLINSAGEVIGINEQIATESGGNQGVGFAVPIDLAKSVMARIREHGTVQTPWLGVRGSTVTEGLTSALHLAIDSGVLVETVVDGSPAARAGLRGGTELLQVQGQTYQVGGDIITKLDDKKVVSMDQLAELIASHMPGDDVTIEVHRDGRVVSLKATLGSLPAGL